MTRRTRTSRETDRRLADLENQHRAPAGRVPLDDAPDELVGRIIRSSRARLDDPTAREVALEAIREFQRRDAAGVAPRFE